LTAADFAFALPIYVDPEMPVLKRTPESYIQAITALNTQTLRIVWREPYAGAASLAEDDLAPLPMHLLQQSYLLDKQEYLQSSFWTSDEYVGSGPFRVKEWQKGISIILNANPYFVLGPPKLETIEVKFLQDGNKVVS